MRSVEFDRDVRGKPALLQRFRGELRVGRSGKEIAAHRDENADRPTTHCLDRFDSVGSVLAWWVEIEFLSKLLHECFAHALANPHRAIALHVRVTAHRTRSGPGTPDVSTEQQEIHDLLDGRDRVA